MSKQAMEQALEFLYLPTPSTLSEAAAYTAKKCDVLNALKESIKQQDEPAISLSSVNHNLFLQQLAASPEYKGEPDGY